MCEGFTSRTILGLGLQGGRRKAGKKEKTKQTKKDNGSSFYKEVLFISYLALCLLEVEVA